jgi:hypothetical protein
MAAGVMSALLWIVAQAAGAESGNGAASGPEAPTEQRQQVPEPPGGELQGGPSAVTQPNEADHPPAARPTVAQPGRIEFRNELGRNYRMTELTFLLDGRTIKRELAEQGGEVRGPLPLYDGPLARGKHRFELRAKLQGRNRGRIFSYMDDYLFDVRSEDAFTVTDHPVAFSVVVGERRGVNVAFEQRPQVVVRSDVSLPPTTQTATGSGAARTVR